MSTPVSNALITCSACGLLCDDIALPETRCQKASWFFAQAIDNKSLIQGKPAKFEEAVKHASEIISQSQRPMIAGLSTDIHGMRALNSLATRLKADLQHINHAGLQRNMQALQSAGWFNTTLGEVKNRADVIVCIGTDIVKHHPRFFERVVWGKNALFTAPNARKIIYLGGEDLDTSHGGEAAWLLPAKPVDLANVLAALHALLLGKTLKVQTVAGIAIADLQTLADTLKQANYAVLAWAAKALDFANATLTIQQISNIVSTLNQTTRAAGLPVGASDGDYSANSVHAWQTGKVLPDSALAQPDAQVWVNSYSPDAPPAYCHMPTIVLGNSNTAWREHADVFIPVATPGLDCKGTMFRLDGSVSLPLKKVRESNLPTLAQVISQIEKLL